MKLLSGLELAGYIKERQARQVRGLRQAYGVFPRLAIVQTNDTPVINTYVSLKQAYGADILVDVDIHKTTEPQASALIESFNTDPDVHGIIVQLPLVDPSYTDILLNSVAPAKDVDALGNQATMDPATPMAINWLLAGYNVDLRGKQVAVVGQGRLVGAPLSRILEASGVQVLRIERDTADKEQLLKESDVIITATGVPGCVTSDMVKTGAVVIDAGVATDAGKLVGDLAEDVYARDDLSITPKKGGVGPLTVCALFDNVIRAARASAET